MVLLKRTDRGLDPRRTKDILLQTGGHVEAGEPILRLIFIILSDIPITLSNLHPPPLPPPKQLS